MYVVETLTEDSIIFHQLHKRVWPSTQRESLFCSHMCSLTNEPRPENMIGHTWMVMNFSLDHDSVPVSVALKWLMLIGTICSQKLFILSCLHCFCSPHLN